MFIKLQFSRLISILLLIILLSIDTAYSLGPSAPHFSAQEESPLIQKKEKCCGSASAKKLKRKLGLYATAAVITGTSVVIFLSEYFLKSEDRKSWDDALSTACTKTIQYVLIPSICIPTARILMSSLQKTRMGGYLGCDHRIDLHKWIVALFGAAALTHSVRSMIHHPGFISTPEGQTGVLMGCSIVGPLLGGYWLKNTTCLNSISYFNKFIKPHQFGFILFTVGYGLHNPHLKLLPWAAIPLGEMTLDRLVELVAYSGVTSLEEARITGGEAETEFGQILLTLKRPEWLKIQAGEFIYLNFNGSTFHPFTVAQFDENSLKVVISPVGAATRELYEQILNNRFPVGATLKIRGSLSSPIQRVATNPNLVLVTTGSGVSVSMAILQALGQLPDEAKLEQKVTLIHSSRRTRGFELVLEAVENARKHHLPIQGIHLYLTGEPQNLEQEDQALEWLNTRAQELNLPLIEVQARNYQTTGALSINELPRESGIYLHRGRFTPDSAILHDPQAHIIVSGNPTFTQMISKYCDERNLEFTKEEFQF